MGEKELRAKIIETALAEVGTGEVPANSNKTKYGAWYGLDGVAWCATFVSWVYHHAGAPLGKVDRPNGYQYCPSAYNFWKKTNQLTTTPKAGDIILFDFANKGISDHTGIFVEMNADGKTFTSIEGNTSPGNSGSQNNGGVVAKRNNRRLSQVLAFVSPTVLGGQKPAADPVVCKKGDIGATVARIQKMLFDLGFEMVVDGDFGSKTEQRVKDFQKEHGYAETGIVTETLVGALEDAVLGKPVDTSKFTNGTYLNQGDSGPGVVSLQKALNKHGAKPQIMIDGVFGEETFKALRNFQKKMDLRVDGVAGPETFKALGIKGI